MVESTIFRTPNLRQLYGRFVESIWLGSYRQFDGESSASACSMHGWAGTVWSLLHPKPKLETDQIHKESRDGRPPGIRRAAGGSSRAVLSLLLPRLKVLFPLPTRATDILSLTAKNLPHEATKDHTLRHGADFTLPTASLGFGWPHKGRLDSDAPNPDFFEGCHDHLLPRNLTAH